MRYLTMSLQPETPPLSGTLTFRGLLTGPRLVGSRIWTNQEYDTTNHCRRMSTNETNDGTVAGPIELGHLAVAVGGGCAVCGFGGSG
jgi:hypothetical protein